MNQFNDSLCAKGNTRVRIHGDIPQVTHIAKFCQKDSYISIHFLSHLVTFSFIFCFHGVDPC
jgi:hypothetical protein